MLGKIRKLIGNRRLRQLLAIGIVVVTIAVFVRFFAVHPEYWRALGHVKLSAVLAIAGLNALLILVLAFIYQCTLALAGKQIPWKEQMLLTAYSSISNFFGPLQSGPAVRTTYLKARHRVRMRDYVLATLVNYALFAAMSALFLFGGSRPWWQTLGALVLVSAFSALVIRTVSRRRAGKGEGDSGFHLDFSVLGYMLVAVFIQVAIVTAYYGIELHAVGFRASLRQIITYSGAANFALFVSITPDAIGFREAFLRFSQQLHHVPTAVIFSANLLDRAVYAAFLVVLFVVVLAFHGRRRLKVHPAPPAPSSDEPQ